MSLKPSHIPVPTSPSQPSPTSGSFPSSTPTSVTSPRLRPASASHLPQPSGSYAKVAKAALPASPSPALPSKAPPPSSPSKSLQRSPYARPAPSPGQLAASARIAARKKGVVPGALPPLDDLPSTADIAGKKKSSAPASSSVRGVGGKSTTTPKEGLGDVSNKKKSLTPSSSPLSPFAPSFEFKPSAPSFKPASPPLLPPPVTAVQVAAEQLSALAPEFEPSSPIVEPPAVEETDSPSPIGVTVAHDSSSTGKPYSSSHTVSESLQDEKASWSETSTATLSQSEAELEEGEIMEEAPPFADELESPPPQGVDDVKIVSHEESREVEKAAWGGESVLSPEPHGSRHGESPVGDSAPAGVDQVEVPVAIAVESASGLEQSVLTREGAEGDVSDPVQEGKFGEQVSTFADAVAESPSLEDVEEPQFKRKMTEAENKAFVAGGAGEANESFNKLTVEESPHRVEPIPDEVNELPISAEEVAALPTLDEIMDVDIPPAPVEVISPRPAQIIAEEPAVDSAFATTVEEAATAIRSIEEPRLDIVDASPSAWSPFEEPNGYPDTKSFSTELMNKTLEMNSSEPPAETSTSILVPASSADCSTPFTDHVLQSLSNPPKSTRGRSPSPERPQTQSALPSEPPSLTLALVSTWKSIAWSRRVPALLASVAINAVLPFINGVMLGFGELFARNFVSVRMGWVSPAGGPSGSTIRANTSSVGLGVGASRLAPGRGGGAGARTAADAAVREVEVATSIR